MLLYYIKHTKLCNNIEIDEIITTLHKDGFLSSDWYKIGVKLGVLESDLRAIAHDEKDADQCLRSVLTKWLETNSSATYQDLVDALNDKCIIAFSVFTISNKSK